MLLSLTCALCTVQLVLTPPAASAGLLERQLSVAEAPPPALAASFPLAPAPLQSHGSGDGDNHSGNMTAMWVVMGAMMAVMLVGAGVYMMRQGSSAATPFPAMAPATPAQRAIPVTSPGSG